MPLDDSIETLKVFIPAALEGFMKIGGSTVGYATVRITVCPVWLERAMLPL